MQSKICVCTSCFLSLALFSLDSQHRWFSVTPHIFMFCPECVLGDLQGRWQTTLMAAFFPDRPLRISSKLQMGPKCLMCAERKQSLLPLFYFLHHSLLLSPHPSALAKGGTVHWHLYDHGDTHSGRGWWLTTRSVRLLAGRWCFPSNAG